MHYSPLRYPGGKRSLARYVGELIELNDLVGGHYAEPYAGGAGLAVTLLYLEYVDHIHLNDLNASVFAFWQSVFAETDEFCRLITETDVTPQEWERQKLIQVDPSASLLEKGFSTFFLNRTNVSGIINGGMIGGKRQAGAWKLDARFNKKELAQRVLKLASFRSRVSIYNLDACVFIEMCGRLMPASSLFYLDPPYYVRGSRLYQNHYQYSDHVEVSRIVGMLKQRWIVSYDNVEPIRALYSAFRQQAFSIRYTARDSRDGSEVMVFGPGLKIPGVIEPWRGLAA